MVRLQSQSFGKCGVPLHYPLSPGVIVPVRVSSMGQIELFNLLLRIIIISYLKPFSCVQVVGIRLEYLIDGITNIE